MAKNAMLRRAFNQAVNRHSAEREKLPQYSKRAFIRNYIKWYAEKNQVDISNEEIDTFLVTQKNLTEN